MKRRRRIVRRVKEWWVKRTILEAIVSGVTTAAVGAAIVVASKPKTH
jgi:hypothetical protein